MNILDIYKNKYQTHIYQVQFASQLQLKNLLKYSPHTQDNYLNQNLLLWINVYLINK